MLKNRFKFAWLRLLYHLSMIFPTKYKKIIHQMKSVEGLLFCYEEFWLYRTAKKLPKGSRLAEIGCYKGRSTSLLAHGCLEGNKRIDSIDLFSGEFANRKEEPFLPVWTKNMKEQGLEHVTKPYVGKSEDVVADYNEQLAFLFIDGSHEYEDVLKDFRNYFPKVVSGGIVAFHDVHPGWPGSYDSWHKVIKQELVDTGQVCSIAYGRKP